MSRFARRKDRNHTAVRRVFEQAGCGVLDVAGLGDVGCDLVVWKQDRCRFIEVKDGAKAPSACKLTDSEARLRLLHPALFRLVSSEADALAVVRELTGGQSCHAS